MAEINTRFEYMRCVEKTAGRQAPIWHWISAVRKLKRIQILSKNLIGCHTQHTKKKLFSGIRKFANLMCAFFLCILVPISHSFRLSSTFLTFLSRWTLTLTVHSKYVIRRRRLFFFLYSCIELYKFPYWKVLGFVCSLLVVVVGSTFNFIPLYVCTIRECERARNHLLQTLQD